MFYSFCILIISFFVITIFFPEGVIFEYSSFAAREEYHLNFW